MGPGCPPDGHARLPSSPTGQGGCRHRPRWLSLINRQKIVREKIENGEPISAIARQMNTSRQTIMRVRDKT